MKKDKIFVNPIEITSLVKMGLNLNKFDKNLMCSTTSTIGYIFLYLCIITLVIISPIKYRGVLTVKILKYLHFPKSLFVITIQIDSFTIQSNKLKWCIIGAPSGFAYLIF